VEDQVYVLTKAGVPVAVSSRPERLSEESASYSVEDQKKLRITLVPNLDAED
jgi:hypothetical protein